MITATQDKKEYTEAIQGFSNPTPSNIPLIPNLDPSKDQASHAFMYKFIARQIKEAKQKLKEDENPRTLTQVGDMYFLSHNYRRAVGYFQMALELDPTFIVAYEKIILAYLTHKDFKNANEYFVKLLKITDRRNDILHRYAIFKAFIYENNQDTEEALSVLDEILQRDDSNFEVLNTYGLILLTTKNDLEGAKKYFNRALEVNKTFCHSLNNLGVCYMNEKNYDQSEKYLLTIVDTTPTYIHSYQNLASAFISQQKYQDAHDILRKAQFRQLKLEPVWDHKVGWLLIMLKKYEEALIWYERKIKDEPKNDLLYNNLGVCLRNLRESEKAEGAFSKAISIFKEKKLRFIRLDQLNPFYNLARLAIEKGDTDTLDQLSKDILAINENDAFGKYARGAWFSLLERYEEAEKMFQESLAISKNIAEVYIYYSFIQDSINKDYTSAIKLLEEAIEKGLGSPLIDNNLAFSYIKSDQLDKAEVIFKKYKDEEDFGVLVATKGLLEFKKKKFEKGNEYYSKAIEKLTGKNVKIANQIWLYEKASYWLNKGDIKKARENLELAKKYPRSYVTRDLSDLEKKLEK